MKAKEEYVDAPRETRSKDITVYAVIFLVLLVGAGIFLAVRLLHKPADAALADSKSGIVYDSSPPLRAAGITFRRRKLRSTSE